MPVLQAVRRFVGLDDGFVGRSTVLWAWTTICKPKRRFVGLDDRFAGLDGWPGRRFVRLDDTFVGPNDSFVGLDVDL